MGKSEQNLHRFRRKAKGLASLSASRETTSDPAVSAPNAVDDLLCDSPAETLPRMQGSRGMSNGRCSDSELTNGVVVGGDGLDDEDGTAPAGDLNLASLLPADLAGLPRSDITLLGSDGSLDLSACHVQGEDSLTLVVFVHNSSSLNIQQVQLELHSDELEVNYFVSNNWAFLPFGSYI